MDMNISGLWNIRLPLSSRFLLASGGSDPSLDPEPQSQYLPRIVGTKHIMNLLLTLL